MNLFELFVKVGVDDQASGALGKITGGLGKGLATAAKIGTAAVSAAAAGITALTTAAVKSYAEYEQLVGGAELMFGKAFNTVQKNAQEAYKTVQMSQNEYLQQVNGFATGLKTALGGNEQAAADLAHKIIKAEADVIAATGNTAENVQNAFNGIMKSNFTMLDNLQIGITPTKEGFQEVIDKVNEWNKANGEATNYQMGNLADMQSALVDYIEMQGLAGYASSEAAGTISGSLAMMKSAWSNLITGVADDNANFDTLINNMVESAGAFAGNLLPRIEVALGGIASLIEKLAPIIVKKIPSLTKEILPNLIGAATNMVNAVVEALPSFIETIITALVENAPLLIEATIGLVSSLIQSIEDNSQILIDGAISIVTTLADGLLSMLPKIISVGLNLIVSLALGIANSLPTLIPTIAKVILQIVDTLTDPKNLQNLLKASLTILTQLAWGIVNSIPQLVDAVVKIIENLTIFLMDPKVLVSLAMAAVEIVLALGLGLVQAIPKLLTSVGEMIASIASSFIEYDWAELGKNIVEGFKNGIKNAWDNLKEWFKDLFGDLKAIAKKILGIKSPSKEFKIIGKFVDEGLQEGLEQGADDVFRTVRNISDGVIDNFDADLEPDYGITTSMTSVSDFSGGSTDYGYGGSQNINVTVGIDNGVNAMGLARALLPFLKIAEKEVYA